MASPIQAVKNAPGDERLSRKANEMVEALQSAGSTLSLEQPYQPHMSVDSTPRGVAVTHQRSWSPTTPEYFSETSPELAQCPVEMRDCFADVSRDYEPILWIGAHPRIACRFSGTRYANHLSPRGHEHSLSFKLWYPAPICKCR
jgi:hypothetical protein